MPLSPELLKRVIYSKYLLQRAKSLEAEAHEIALACSILTAHDAVEMLMRVVTDSLNLLWPSRFMEFWNVVERKKARPPLSAAMEQLNDDRNGFKHKGISPNPANVGERLRKAVTFCEELSRDYLETNYQAVSLADLVQNEAARELVKKAEAAKLAEDLTIAMTNLGLAYDELFSEARQKHEEALVGRIPITNASWIQDDSKSIKLKLDKVAETVDALILGVDPAKLRRFSTLTPIRQHPISGPVSFVWRRDANRLTTEDFNFCHTFVIDFGLRNAQLI